MTGNESLRLFPDLPAPELEIKEPPEVVIPHDIPPPEYPTDPETCEVGPAKWMQEPDYWRWLEEAGMQYGGYNSDGLVRTYYFSRKVKKGQPEGKGYVILARDLKGPESFEECIRKDELRWSRLLSSKHEEPREERRQFILDQMERYLQLVASYAHRRQQYQVDVFSQSYREWKAKLDSFDADTDAKHRDGTAQPLLMTLESEAGV